MGKQQHDTPNTRDVQTMPVQWCLKGQLTDGRAVELILRRVMTGHETPIEIRHDSASMLHLRGRYSDAQTCRALLESDALPSCQRAWMEEALSLMLVAFASHLKHASHLVHLFTPKGKLEIYQQRPSQTSPQYVSSNHTLKCSLAHLQQDAAFWLMHAMAQHLDYPFGSGERRFSTSRLFDLCFHAEKFLAPRGLAAHIDSALESRGIFQPSRQIDDAHARVTQLLDGQCAAIRNSYERVLQRERFAAVIEAFYHRAPRGIDAPLLGSFKQLVAVDLLAQAKNGYKDYPTKGIDQRATAMHVPLLMIFGQELHHG